jgi:hypothetical protein
MGHHGVMDRDVVRRALETDTTVDIVTTGRRTGQPRTIEIWFVNLGGRIHITGTVSDHDPGTPYPRDWLANLIAEPRMIFRLKESVRADLPARAEVVRDPLRRRQVFTRPETRWYREQGETIDDLVVGAPLVELTFVEAAAWLAD